MKVLKIFATVLIILVLVGVGGIFYLSRGLDEGENLIIERVDLSLIDDGVYNGEYTAGRFSNKVRVEIKDNKIVKLSLLEDLRFDKPEVTEELFNRIIAEQKNNVDVITGTTISCKSYLKAVENALLAASK